MANPTRVVADFRRRFGRDPKVSAAINERFEKSDQAADIRAMQEGKITPQEFADKWINN